MGETDPALSRESEATAFREWKAFTRWSKEHCSQSKPVPKKRVESLRIIYSAKIVREIMRWFLCQGKESVAQVVGTSIPAHNLTGVVDAKGKRPNDPNRII